MPYTKPLTEAGKEAERQRKRTEIFLEAYGGRQKVLRFKNYEIAEQLECSDSTLRRWMHNIDQMPTGALFKLMRIVQIPTGAIEKMAEVK